MNGVQIEGLVLAFKSTVSDAGVLLDNVVVKEHAGGVDVAIIGYVGTKIVGVYTVTGGVGTWVKRP